MKNNYVIGVLGGMGTYATIHLFRQFAEVFPAEKEWDRPRIIIDNRCTMPSRVRAFLYNEKTDQLVDEMADSMKCLMEAGCSRIILGCNTSHLFLPRIYEKVPELEPKVIHIINNCADQVVRDKVPEVYVLGTEGTIDSGIYQSVLAEKGITCLAPSKDEYYKLRNCIEAVKQNDYSDGIRDTFLELVNRYDDCILGCTELPILYEKYKDGVVCINVYDPVYLALCRAREEFLITN
jgi:aspartate racemase